MTNLSRSARLGALGLSASALAMIGSPAAAQDRQRVEVSPYVAIDQSVFTDLSGDQGTDTFTTLSAGIDASTYTRRMMAQASLRYQHSFSWDDDSSDVDIFSGLVSGAFQATRGLSLEAGGIATRTRVDGGGTVIGSRIDDDGSVTDVYSVYGGPTYQGNVGDVGVAAAYRIGYTAVDGDRNGAGGFGGGDYFDDSTQHLATASVSQLPGPLPVGWAVSGSYYREDAGQLDQRVEDYYVRGDLTVPVSATLALVGGVGYENVEVSERDALRDGVTGAPIRDRDGRFVTDESSPRLTSFSTDGLLWDVGVLWRPSSRTSLEARVGERYGSTTYYGSFSWAASTRTAVNISAYDRVSGFGGLLNDTIANLGTDFDVYRDPFTGDLEGCAIGDDGAACFGSALQSARSASFRARGITASISSRSGAWSYGGGIGYQNRDYYVSALGGQSSLAGTEDEVWFAGLGASRTLGRAASLGLNVYGNAYDPALTGDTIYSVGANATYGQELMRNLNLRAALGIDAVDYPVIEDQVTASGLLGLSYGF